MRHIALTLILVGFCLMAVAAWQAGHTGAAAASIMLGIVNWLLF